jgi:hypothetical protein
VLGKRYKIFLQITLSQAASFSLRYVKDFELYPIAFCLGATVNCWAEKFSFDADALYSSIVHASLNIKINGYVSKSVYLSNTIGLEWAHKYDSRSYFHRNDWNSNFFHTSIGIGYTIGGAPYAANYQKGQKIANIPIFAVSSMALLTAAFVSFFLSMMD